MALQCASTSPEGVFGVASVVTGSQGLGYIMDNIDWSFGLTIYPDRSLVTILEGSSSTSVSLQVFAEYVVNSAFVFLVPLTCFVLMILLVTPILCCSRICCKCCCCNEDKCCRPSRDIAVVDYSPLTKVCSWSWTGTLQLLLVVLALAVALITPAVPRNVSAIACAATGLANGTRTTATEVTSRLDAINATLSPVLTNVESLAGTTNIATVESHLQIFATAADTFQTTVTTSVSTNGPAITALDASAQTKLNTATSEIITRVSDAKGVVNSTGETFLTALRSASDAQSLINPLLEVMNQARSVLAEVHCPFLSCSH